MKTFLAALLFAVSLFAQLPKPGGSSGGGGAATTPGGAVSTIQYNNAGVFGGATGASYVESNATPAAPVVVTSGTPGVTSIGYKVAFHYPTGDSAASAQTLITTSNAVLDGTNFNVITAPACSNVYETVDIFVSTAGGNIPDVGFLANVACSGTYNHQGLDADPDSQIPASDFSRGVYIPSTSTVPGALTIGGAPPDNLSSPQRDFESVFNLGGSSGSSYAFFWSAGGTAQIRFSKSNGTATAPTIVQDGDGLGGIIANGYDGSSWDNGRARLDFIVDGVPSAGIIKTLAEVCGGNTGSRCIRIRNSGGWQSVGLEPVVSGCTAAALVAGGTSVVGQINNTPTGTCVVTLTFPDTMTNGYNCAISNQTTANLIRQTASSPTTAVFTGTTVANDVLAYGPCVGW